MESPVTIAKMIKITETSPPILHPEFLEYLIMEKKDYAILVYSVSTRTIRLIPTETGRVVKITIEIDELTPGFLDELGRVLTTHKVDTLYSSGICFTEDSCQYEGYIDQEDIDSTILDPLRNKLLTIRGISSVDLLILTA
jgi:hypothetical protein